MIFTAEPDNVAVITPAARAFAPFSSVPYLVIVIV